MRQHKFIVYFSNQAIYAVYAGALSSALILASAYAINNAWDRSIDKVYDETDNIWYNKILLESHYQEVKT